jgi:phage baseplate assembly protein gpV
VKRKSGVVTAFVHDVDTEHGQVIVEYRHIQEGLLSPWAPVAAPLSGKSRGALFMPEKGDEVLVAFHDGVFEHPYIVGFLWNGEQVSPETEPHNRVIVTPGGNQLRFEDKPNDTRIVLKSAGGRSVTLDDKPTGPQIEIKSGSHRILMDDKVADPTVEIKAGTGPGVTITMHTLPPSLTVQIDPTTSLSVGPSGVTLNATGVLNVVATGVANIQCATANLTAASFANITAPALNVNAALANFSGVLIATTMVTSSVVSPLYTPGIGNFI